MSETLMTEAATTTEGQAASTQAAEQSATGAGEGGQQQQSTEGQTAATEQGADGKSEGEQTQTEQKSEDKGAPDKYEFQAPEGKEFSPEVIAAFSEVAKELNLPQAEAQKVIDKIAPALAERQTKAIEQARADWAESAKTDKEFGGDKLAENLGFAKKALDEFGTPELRTLLNESGLGNHPELIRAFYRAGKAISEDRVVTGSGAQSAQQSVAQRMYPNMNP